ncbi:SDR family NAD(P)-dependent oxidoreductase [Streptomyces sp. NPDC059564]|uniref:SDR family NAD(P)-dependent oxidoreductase n=1 Tax=Streptomyces sp. NPDC059564 TaxID=3346865 RepID=UPI0036B5CF4C
MSDDQARRSATGGSTRALRDTDRRRSEPADRAIAIVGVAGIFPEAENVGQFWANIVAGRDCTREVPEEWWSLAEHHDPDVLARDKTYARRGGFLPSMTFDPLEFGMPPASLDSIGLVQLLGLLAARDVLRDAGCPDAAWYDPARTGVVLGVCGSNSTALSLGSRLVTPEIRASLRGAGVSRRQTDEAVRRYLEQSPEWTEDSFPGVLGNVVAGRVANRFGLGGANYTVDAACASSLAALRGAITELVEHRADLMITGGCDADNSVLTYLCFSKTPALSPTDRVRPFDRDGDGTLLGEGIGMLALKRLADAERDLDRIYAVIRGLGSASDGRTSSIYAPCGDGQTAALRAAYTDAGVPAESVELIEAHGTGTRVGDSVEAAALSTFLATPSDRRFVALGSVKSQIGHAKAAAGAAGLIKAALSLHHRVLPATIGIGTPVEELGDPDGPLYANTRTRPWIRDPRRPVRRAGVSGFGFGGVNFHAVLEEHRSGEDGLKVVHPTPRACLWHAPDREALLALLESGAAPRPLGPIPADHARLGFVATDQQHQDRLRRLAQAQLRAQPGHRSWQHAEGIHYRSTALPAHHKVAALFVGQGSQYVDMGLDGLLSVPPLRAAFDAANALWTEGETLARVVFPVPGTDPAVAAARLRRTSYAQPAIGALSMGQFRHLSELGFVPDVALGHSFGELTALWAAGSFCDDAFVRLAAARGRAMDVPARPGADPGAMVAVRLSERAALELAAPFPGLVICNRNGEQELVLGGPTTEVDAFVTACLDRRLPVQRLAVSAAFHTRHVAHAVEGFAQALAAEEFRTPAVPVLANTAGAAYGADPEHNRRILAGQLARPVEFGARLAELYAGGVRVFVEFGPRQTLGNLVRRTFAADGEVEVIPTDIGAGTGSALALRQAAVQLAMLGHPIRDINRHDVEAAPPPAGPSSVARVLTGPNFAANAVRQRLRDDVPPPLAEPVPVPVPVPVERIEIPSVDHIMITGTGQDRLGQAAADHLALHNRFLEGQLAVARDLAELLGGPDGADAGTVARAALISEHSVALSNAHTRASEVFAELMRLPLSGVPAGPPELPVHHDQPDYRPAFRDSEQEAAPAQPVIPVARASRPPEREQAPRPVPALPAEPTVPDFAEVERVLREIVAEKTGYAFDMVDPDLDIRDDLGIDSLKQVEIAAEAWRCFPQLPREEVYQFAAVRTVRDLSEILRAVLARPAPALSAAEPVPLGRAFVSLRELPAPDELVNVYGHRPTALLLDDGSKLAELLRQALDARHWQVRSVRLPQVSGEGPQLADWSEQSLSTCVLDLTSAGPLALCLLPAGRDALADPAQVVARLRHAVLVAKHAAPALRAMAANGSRGAFVTVTELDGALGLAGSGGDPIAALVGGLGGLAKSLALEESDLFCRSIDLAPELDPALAGRSVLAELTDPESNVCEIAYDAQARRRTPWLSPEPAPLVPVPANPEPDRDDLLLVTGGARGITSWCIAGLADRSGSGFLLLGRTPLLDAPAWAGDSTDPVVLRELLAQRMREEGHDPGLPGARAALDHQSADLARQQEVRATLAELRAKGVRAEYVAADVGDAEAVQAALEPYARRITGLVHGAGILADERLADKGPRNIARVLDAKLTGLLNVLTALDGTVLRHLVLFTSVSGVFGNSRQTDYALANEALNRFACAWQATHPDCRVSSLAWGPWRGGMASPGMQELFLQHGVPLLTREEGVDYFAQQMSADRTGDLIAVIGPVAPVFRRRGTVPAEERTVRRETAGLGQDPVLDHHRIDGLPVLPMTAALGCCLNVLESLLGPDQPVLVCREFAINRGLVFDGTEPVRLDIDVRPTADPAAFAVQVRDEPSQAPRFQGRFHLEHGDPVPDRITLPAPLPAAFEPHPAYRDGFLFHGPVLQGLGSVLHEEPALLLLAARLPDPVLATGAYGTGRYRPGGSDVLLQAAALLGRSRVGLRCLPVSVGQVDLFAPLPDDEQFAVLAELTDESPLDLTFTVTACAADGRVLQRWSGLRMVIAVPELAARAAWPGPAEVSGP